MDSKVRDRIHSLVLSQKGRLLSPVELTLLEGGYQDATYEAIAQASGEYSVNYLKRDVGPKLWKLLSDTLGEKVSKTNLREVLERNANPDDEQEPASNDTRFAIKLAAPARSNDLQLKQNQDWGEAINLSEFYGRDDEILELKRWILQERCRVVSLMGLGGAGKTSLCVKLAQQIQPHYEYVIWRSLHDAPPIDDLLSDMIRFITGSEEFRTSTESLITQLIHCLHRYRCLLVLDSIEGILQPRGRAGRYLPNYEKYGELIKRVGEEGYRIDERHQLGEADHQSCLVVVGREKPNEVALMEGKRLFVRSLKINGLKSDDAQNIIKVKGFAVATDQEAWNQLIDRYSGNPLALKIAATAIYELFGGGVSAFLTRNKFVFDQIDDLIGAQISRLSFFERRVLTCLAINRSTVSFAELESDIVSPEIRSKFLGVVKSLSDRSLIEIDPAGFTLQPMIMEHASDRLVEWIVSEISQELDFKDQEKPELNNYTLLKPQAKAAIRDSQTLTLIRPILDKLILRYGSKENVREQLEQLLEKINQQASLKWEYAKRNLDSLLHQLTAKDYVLITSDVGYLSVDFNSLPLMENRLLDVEGLGNILSVSYSNDREFLVVGDTEGVVHLWRISPKTHSLTQHLSWQAHDSLVRSVAFHPSSKILVSGSQDRTIKLWDIGKLQATHAEWKVGDVTPLKSLRTKDWVRSTAFSPDGKILAAGSDGYLVQLWRVLNEETAELKELKTLERESHTDRVRSIAFSADNRLLASGSDDCTVKLWDLNSLQCIETLKDHTGWVRSVAFSPDSRLLASSSDDRTVKLWDLAKHQCVETFREHQDRVRSVAFNAAGNLLASGSDDCTIKLWDVVSRQLKANLGRLPENRVGRIQSVIFSPDGQTLASGNDNQRLKLWDVGNYRSRKTYQGRTNAVCSILFANASTLISGGHDRVIKIWDLEQGKCVRSLIGHASRINSLALSGNILVSGSDDCTIKIWNSVTGQCVQTLQSTHWVRSVVFSPQGNALAIAGDNQEVQLWKIEEDLVPSSEQMKLFREQTHWIRTVAFSPDGSMIASGGDAKEIWFWDIESRTAPRKAKGRHEHRIRSLAFSPNIKQPILASGSDDATIKFWDVVTGNAYADLEDHTDGVKSVAFSQDGKILASGGDDGIARLWNVETQKIITRFPKEHHSGIRSVCFSPNGKILATSRRDGEIKLWNLETHQCIQTLISSHVQ